MLVAKAPADLPHPLDTLNILRDDAGHVAWFDEFHGLRPAYWAWADYATGGEEYGTDPSWPKNQPGGKLPGDLPVPELPGGNRGAQRITARGRLAEAKTADGDRGVRRIAGTWPELTGECLAGQISSRAGAGE